MRKGRIDLWPDCEMGHESFERDERIAGSSDRAFGLVFAAVFAIIAFLPIVFGGSVRLWSLILAAAFVAVALARPALLAPLNHLWLKLGLLLHRVVSPVVLGIMFFLVVTPIGLLMRAFGKDPLRLKRDPTTTSYWIPREPPGPTPESLKDQF
jgi:hypothetical protein